MQKSNWAITMRDAITIAVVIVTSISSTVTIIQAKERAAAELCYRLKAIDTMLTFNGVEHSEFKASFNDLAKGQQATERRLAELAVTVQAIAKNIP